MFVDKEAHSPRIYVRKYALYIISSIHPYISISLVVRRIYYLWSRKPDCHFSFYIETGLNGASTLAKLTLYDIVGGRTQFVHDRQDSRIVKIKTRDTDSLIQKIYSVGLPGVLCMNKHRDSLTVSLAQNCPIVY